MTNFVNINGKKKTYRIIQQRNKTKFSFQLKYLLIYKLNSLTLTKSITENITKQLRGFDNPLQISKLGTVYKTFCNLKQLVTIN